VVDNDFTGANVSRAQPFSTAGRLVRDISGNVIGVNDGASPRCQVFGGDGIGLAFRELAGTGDIPTLTSSTTVYDVDRIRRHPLPPTAADPTTRRSTYIPPNNV
jgi:hypothetical protein